MSALQKSEKITKKLHLMNNSQKFDQIFQNTFFLIDFPFDRVPVSIEKLKKYLQFLENTPQSYRE